MSMDFGLLDYLLTMSPGYRIIKEHFVDPMLRPPDFDPHTRIVKCSLCGAELRYGFDSTFPTWQSRIGFHGSDMHTEEEMK